jgi:hypothetical protein
MRKISLIANILILLGATAVAQSLTQAERDKGVQYLEQTRDGVVAAVRGLSDTQMNFKPAPDRWSVAEVVEHLALAEDDVRSQIENGVMKSPAGGPDRETAKIDAGIVMMVPDRSRKAKAPSQLVPSSRWAPAEALDHYVKSRAQTIEFLKTTPDLREHAADSPIGGPKWDGYEFLLFMGAHSARHTKQIDEVKADPNFPRS